MASDAAGRFFVVTKGRRGNKYDTEFLKADRSTFGEAPRCETCGRPIGMRRWLPPFRVEVKLHGSEWGDFAFFGLAEFLVSDRAAAAIENGEMAGLSGFEPVEVVKVEGGAPPVAYRHVDVAFSEAVVDQTNSSLVRRGEVTCERCGANGLDAIDGFVIETGSWTGEDLFVARGLPGVVVATERFRRLVEDHELSNIDLVPTERYKWDARAPSGVSRDDLT